MPKVLFIKRAGVKAVLPKVPGTVDAGIEIKGVFLVSLLDC
jgi:hypothetical protein